MQGVHGEPEHQRAQQHLRPLRQRVPALDQTVVGLAPRQRVDDDHAGRPRRRPPVRGDVGDARRRGPREKHCAVQVAVHQLVGALGRLAQPGQLVDQLDRTLPVRRARRHRARPAAATAAAAPPTPRGRRR